jgi:hypothetical protein
MSTKKKKIAVPKPTDESTVKVTAKDISFSVIEKMDKDIQTRLVFAGIKLDQDWLVKMFAVCCEEMYFRATMKSMKDADLETKRQLEEDLRYYGFKIS